MSPEEAKDILDKVRSWYSNKNGTPFKSGNKSYAPNKPAKWAANQKWQKRNDKVLDAGKIVDANREEIKKLGPDLRTPYGIGGLLYTGNEAPSTLNWTAKAGNCGEMATIAVYLATEIYEVPAHQAFVLGFTAPKYGPVTGAAFGHEAAFFGDCQGVGNGRTPNPEGLVVDPWANICCCYNDYPTQFKNKMGGWKDQQKWIKHPGHRDMWLKPTDATLDIFAPRRGNRLRGYRPAATLSVIRSDEALIA